MERRSFLEREKVALCLLSEENINKYASWMNNPDVRLFSHNLPTYTPREYRNLISNPSSECYLFEIFYKPVNQVVGISGLIGISWKDRIGFSSTHIGNIQLWSKRIGTESGMLQFKFGFEYLNLRKIFSVIYSSNIASIQLAKKVMTLEAVLKDIAFINGQYCDQLIFSITQELWFDIVHNSKVNQKYWF